MRLHLNKGGIRALGVAESFRQGDSRSTLVGVVMRGDGVIDGFAVGKTTVAGNDATRSIASLYRTLGRNDVNLLLVSGCILSLYNIVDADELSHSTKLPVICLTYKETSGIQDAIRRHFPQEAEEKLESYRRLEERTRVRLRSGHYVFVRTSGLEEESVIPVLDLFTIQGSVPEPIRVARLLARTLLRRASGRRPHKTTIQ